MNTPRLNTQILEEASEWFVNLRDGEPDPATRVAFDAWLNASPEHVRAYLDVASIWADMAEVNRDHTPGAPTLISQARAEGTVVSLGFPESPSEAPATARVPPSVTPYLWAASFLLALFGAGVIWWGIEHDSTYVTGIGEQRSFTLADGSRVELNTRSRLAVRFSDNQRTIDLLEGQALFQVAKDPARPFVVRTDGTQVKAVGTQFDVYRKEGGTTVTVIEGKVAIIPAQLANPGVPQAEHEPGDGVRAPTQGVLLSAGEQVVVRADRIVRPRPVNVALATAWTQRQLVFESASLSEVAREFNRYNARSLVLVGAPLTDFHISGVFSSTDPRPLVQFLREQPGIVVQELELEIRVSRDD